MITAIAWLGGGGGGGNIMDIILAERRKALYYSSLTWLLMIFWYGTYIMYRKLYPVSVNVLEEEKRPLLWIGDDDVDDHDQGKSYSQTEKSKKGKRDVRKKYYVRFVSTLVMTSKRLSWFLVL